MLSGVQFLLGAENVGTCDPEAWPYHISLPNSIEEAMAKYPAGPSNDEDDEEEAAAQPPEVEGSEEMDVEDGEQSDEPESEDGEQRDEPESEDDQAPSPRRSTRVKYVVRFFLMSTC